ncbi:hypothetical protein AURDEDRAFT_90941 [Auricularia subglabra TFB-10046 SS5]|nr:hypothetical protein AURDEDRAFT_90941 [Auricularia subglabra TFB-10046 SS5]
MHVEATIVHAYHPFTMSAVLRVQPGKADLPQDLILKLFDRRFMNNIREDEDPPADWSPEKDADYAQWLQDLTIGKEQPTDFEDSTLWDREEVTGERFEGFLQHEALKFYAQEVAAYDVLSELQGDLIPRFYGTVAYRDIPGILLEYVPGPTLREIVATWTARTPRLPDAELARVCEAAVSVMGRIAWRYEIINLDVRIDNFICCADGGSMGRSPVVLIDLAQCEKHGKETDEEWREWKAGLDEIGAVGQVIGMKVRQQVGPDVWHYDAGSVLKYSSAS